MVWGMSPLVAACPALSHLFMCVWYSSDRKVWIAYVGDDIVALRLNNGAWMIVVREGAQLVFVGEVQFLELGLQHMLSPISLQCLFFIAVCITKRKIMPHWAKCVCALLWRGGVGMWIMRALRCVTINCVLQVTGDEVCCQSFYNGV